MNRQGRLNLKTQIRQAWAIFRLATRKFSQIDGAQWAGAFSFHAFFSLFPLMLLLVTITTVFIDRDRAATEAIAYVNAFVPINGDKQSYILDTITSVINARRRAGVVAFLLLTWIALQCFTTLVSATNRAWGVTAYSWWRLPLKSLVLLWITTGVVLLGAGVMMLVQIAKNWLFTMDDTHFLLYALGRFFIPLLMLFFGLSLFYRLAPHRPTRFSEVWAAALFATALLLVAQDLFVIYLKYFATLNAVYGALGGIMALLLWIYISGGIFIFGACLCAARKEVL